MTEIWYRAGYEKVCPIEIERATEKQIVKIGGQRENKISQGVYYAKTHAEAKALMVAYYQSEYDAALRQLKCRKERLEKAEAC